MRLPPMADRVLRNEIRRTNDWLRQLGPQIGRTVVVKQGVPSVVTQSVNLTDFLYLPGRSPRQVSKGNVQFDADGGFEAQPLETVVGLSLKAIQAAGNTTTVYFNLGDSGQDYIGRWTFPITSTTPSDNIFVSESAGQTLTNKVIQQGTIWVGTNSAGNTFRSTTNGSTQDFKISPNTGFPTTAVLTPTLRLPSLDTQTPLTDLHTFMMIASQSTTPFTKGSIAHGNIDASEMEMLAAGTNGAVLQYNSGEVISGSWTTGTFTITGAFTAANTKVGMRVRGASGLNIYVDRDTRITAVTPGVSITVDTALVGNAVGVSVTTYGPIWSTALGAVDHGSLGGLTDDDHPQYLLLAGRSGGQVLGAGAHTGGNSTDLSVEGRLLLGDALSGVNFTAGRALDIRHTMTNGAVMVNLQPSLTSLSGAASGTLTGLQIVVAGTPGYTSGSFSGRGLFFTATLTVPSGVTLLEGLGGQFQTALSTVSGTSSKLTGLRVITLGSNISNVALPTMIGFDISIGNRQSIVTDFSGLNFVQNQAVIGAVTNFRLIDSAGSGGATAVQDAAAVVNWTGWYLPNVTNPSGTILGLDIAIKGNKLAGLRIGTGAYAGHLLEIEAGTTTRAPAIFTSGTNLTSATAGAVEYDGTFFFMTNGTSTRRQVVLTDAAAAGSIIYGDASGQHFLNLANGTSGQALVSGGGTAAPAWATLDNTYLANRARSEMWGAHLFGSTPVLQEAGSAAAGYLGIAFSGATDNDVFGWFRVPNDFVSISSFQIGWTTIGTSTNNLVWRFGIQVVTDAQDMTVGATTSDTTVAPSAGVAERMNIDTLTDPGVTLAAGDIVRVYVARRANSDGNDTNTDSVLFNFVKFNYTADM